MRKTLKSMIVACVITCSLLLPVSYAAEVELKPSAPETYTVKKDDTLWHIASIFLDQPWLWPDLWRNNTQIENPHLIYPGDVILIRYVDGKPELMLKRDKKRLVLSPTSTRTEKPAVPINVLPWSVIEPYVAENEIVTEVNFEQLPHLLGNETGNTRFVSDDLVLSDQQGPSTDQYRVIRRDAIIRDMNDEVLGIQIHHIADATLVADEATNTWLVKIQDINEEAKRGDKLKPVENVVRPELVLHAASKDQQGYIVDSLHQHNLLGKHDVVIVDLGESEVSPGTVMGIYTQGPEIINSDSPRYEGEGNAITNLFTFGDNVSQPALKVGELIIFNTFDNASYGIITRASSIVRKGAIISAP